MPDINSSSPSDEAVATPTPDRRLVLWMLFAALGVYAAMQFNAEPLQSANDRSRWATVRALTEHGTFIIDDVIRRPGWDTIDKVRHEGHFYSSKPPLLATLVAALAWLVMLPTGWTLADDSAAVARTVLLLINLLPAGLAVLLLDRMAERYSKHRFTRWLVILTAVWGTLLSPFLMTLNNHTIAAVSVMFTVYAAHQGLLDRTPRMLPYAMAGFFAAMACCHELPAAAFSTAIFVILARRDWKATAIAFVPAALVPLAAFFLTNYLVTGGIKPFYTYYGTEKYEYVFNGVPSYWMDPQGVDRNVDSFFTYLTHCLIGHHGWFSLTPIFLLMPVGWVISAKKQDALRLWVLLGAGMWVLVLAFYLTRTGNYNYGGVSVALRWLLWLVPLSLLALIPAIDRIADRRLGRGATITLLVLSVFSAWVPMPNPWQQTWLFRSMSDIGWIDYSVPPEPLRHRLWTWFATVPDTARCEPWQEFTLAEPDGTLVVHRLTAQRAADSRQTVLILSDPDGQAIWTALIDANAFRDGEPLDAFLLGPYSNREGRQSLATHLRGLPEARPYQPGRTSYLNTPLRDDAFRCQRVASQVYHVGPDKMRRRYRADIWLCDDLPFGVARMDFSIYDLSGTLLNRQSWIVSAVNGKDCPPQDTAESTN